MLRHDFEASVGYWICMASRAYEKAINDELAPRGITYRQAQVLGWLALEQNLSQIDLAERMRIEPPTLVGILDRMEREGWIKRESCPTDRRRKLICAQSKAEPVWSKIIACAEKVRNRATAGLSAEEVIQLHQLLRKIVTNLPIENANTASNSTSIIGNTVNSESDVFSSDLLRGAETSNGAAQTSSATA